MVNFKLNKCEKFEKSENNFQHFFNLERENESHKFGVTEKSERIIFPKLVVENYMINDDFKNSKKKQKEIILKKLILLKLNLKKISKQQILKIFSEIIEGFKVLKNLQLKNLIFKRKETIITDNEFKNESKKLNDLLIKKQLELVRFSEHLKTGVNELNKSQMINKIEDIGFQFSENCPKYLKILNRVSKSHNEFIERVNFRFNKIEPNLEDFQAPKINVTNLEQEKLSLFETSRAKNENKEKLLEELEYK